MLLLTNGARADDFSSNHHSVQSFLLEHDAQTKAGFPNRTRTIKLAGQAPIESKILQPRSLLEWTGPPADLMLTCMGQANRTGSCPRCGRAMKVALLPEASMPCGPQYIGCEKSDPLKSELVTGWLNGELGRPKRSIIRPK